MTLFKIVQINTTFSSGLLKVFLLALRSERMVVSNYANNNTRLLGDRVLLSLYFLSEHYVVSDQISGITLHYDFFVIWYFPLNNIIY